MLSDGSCVLWEHWSGVRGSLNHHMRSPVAAWIYRTLAGINIDESAPGFLRIIIQPHFTEMITSLRAYHKTPHGMVKISYDEENVYITIPENTCASLTLGEKTCNIAPGTTVIKR